MKVRIKRQVNSNSLPYWQTFEYNGPKDVTVVAVLNAINYTDDLYDIDGNPTTRIRWECSCMQGMCGGCAMVINNTPALACTTFIKNLKKDELVLEPLSKFPVIADLMVDRSVIYENLSKVEAYLTDRSEALEKDYPLRYSVAKCLKCGLCLEVCPNYTNGMISLELCLRTIYIYYIAIKHQIKNNLLNHIMNTLLLIVLKYFLVKKCVQFILKHLLQY